MPPELDPTTDPRLTPAERDMYSRVYPLIQQIEDELEVDMSRLVAVNMVRRAVSRGATVEDLVTEVRHHAEHQLNHNAGLRQANH